MRLSLTLLACGLCAMYMTSHAQDDNRTLWSATWSADGSYIAVGGIDSTLSIYDGRTYRLVQKVHLGSWLLRARWHPEEPLLAVATDGHDDSTGCRIIDVTSGETTFFRGLSSGSRAITWSPDGKHVAIADYAGIITIWTREGRLIRSIKKANTKSFTSVDWHPYEDMLVVVGEFILLYDTGGNLLRKIKHRTDNVLLLCACWHPSGSFFALGDYGTDELTPLLQFWSSEGELLFESDLSAAEYRNVSWDSSGDRLATASDALRIWNKEGQLLRTFPSEALLWGVDWSPDGSRLVTSSFAGEAVVWDVVGQLSYTLE